jgi:hypothetical protein
MHNALRIAASPLTAALLIGAPAPIAFTEEATSPAAESGPAEPAPLKSPRVVTSPA